MGTRLPTHLVHAIEDEGAVVVHALGPSPERSGENGGEARALFAVYIPGGGSVPGTRRGFRAINARAPFDHVEVELENALLAEDEFGHRYQRGLRTLAQDGAAGSEKEVFY